LEEAAERSGVAGAVTGRAEHHARHDPHERAAGERNEPERPPERNERADAALDLFVVPDDGRRDVETLVESGGEGVRPGGQRMRGRECRDGEDDGSREERQQMVRS
jgi:hypothetical protein